MVFFYYKHVIIYLVISYEWRIRKDINKILFPSTLKTIGNNSFSSCKGLKEITIPSGVTLIDESAFCNCTSIKEINLPSTLKIICEDAFHLCNSLDEIIIPEGVEIIGGGAFGSCSSLKKVVLPTTIKKIGLYAFHNFSASTIVIVKNIIVKYKDYTDLLTFIERNKFFLKEYLRQNKYTNSNEKLLFVGPPIPKTKRVNIALELGSISGYSFNNNTQLYEIEKKKDLEVDEITLMTNKIKELAAFLPASYKEKVNNRINTLLNEYHQISEEFKPKYDHSIPQPTLTDSSVETIKPNLVSSLNTILVELESLNTYNDLIKELKGYEKSIDEGRGNKDTSNEIEIQIKSIIDTANNISPQKKEQIKNLLKKSIEITIDKIQKEISSMYEYNFNNIIKDNNYKLEFSKKLSLLEQIVSLEYELLKESQVGTKEFYDIKEFINESLVLYIRSIKEIIATIPDARLREIPKKMLNDCVINYINKVINNLTNNDIFVETDYQKYEEELRADLFSLLLSIKKQDYKKNIFAEEQDKI